MTSVRGALWAWVGPDRFHRHVPNDFADLPPLATWDRHLFRILPLVFAISTGISVRNYVFEPATIGFDAVLYTSATRSWLAGGDPWAVSIANIHYGAPPPTLIAFIPFAPLPDSLVIWISVIGSFLLAFLAIRALRLPAYWLFFWPIVDGSFLGNPDVAVFALLVIARARLSGLAPLLKIYAFFPLGSMAHWKAIAAAVVLLVVTAPFLPWSLWLADLPSITAGLERYSVTTSVAGSLPLMVIGIVALVALGYRRAGWLAVPVLWPFTQPHYLAMSIPVLTPTLAILWSIPGPPPLVMLASVVVAAIGFRLFPSIPARVAPVDASPSRPPETPGQETSPVSRPEITAQMRSD